MTWLWWWIRYGPHKALDWHDAHGEIDHGKAAADIVIFIILLSDAIVSIRSGTYVPLGHVIALVAGGMGARVFIALIRSKSLTSAETLTGSLHGTAARPLPQPIDHPDAS